MSIERKSQISMEFTVLTGFLVMLSFIFILAATYHLNEYSEDTKKIIVTDFGESIKGEIKLASTVKEGYERSFSLPEKISGYINYTISLSNNELIISTDDFEYSAIVPSVQGSLTKNSTNIIRNNGGVVTISNA